MAKSANLNFVLICVFIDMLGIGLIVPVLPSLVGEFVDNRAQQAWWDRSIRACLQQHAAFLKGISTPNHARDLNLVRAILGFRQADLLGVSSGSSLMAYADRMFPDRFERVVLDSNMDWSHLDWQRQALRRVPMDQLNLQQALIPFMARHDDQFHMGTTPQQVLATFQKIYQATSQHRMGSVTPDQALGSLDGTGMWVFWDLMVSPSLSAMSKALDGDPADIANAEQMAAMTYADLPSATSFNPMADVLGAEVVLIAGANVAECAPVTTSYVWQARENGAKVIVIDPRITPLARTADLFLPVKPGRDVALFNGMLHLMIENGWVDRDFIARHVNGFDAVAEHVRQWTPTRTAQVRLSLAACQPTIRWAKTSTMNAT